MIRREMQGGWQLIRQDDHARIAGVLASSLGGTFQSLTPDAIEGIARHDDGWPLHDDRPTLDDAGEPTDVFHTPRAIDQIVWAASAERAAAVSSYAGLLVSIHSLRLSAGVFGSTTHALPDLPPRERFELNRFQHGQIELQETLRRELGMSTETPLRLGVAEGNRDPRELQLEYDYTWLAALDLLSLAICCTKPPTDAVRPALARPDGIHGQLSITRPEPDLLTVTPWPFEPPAIELSVPYRAIARGSYEGEESFRAVYAATPTQTFPVTVKPQSK